MASSQAQAQAQSQSGLGGERQRERQVERAYISSRDAESGTHLATGVRQSSPVGPAALWGGLVAVGLAIAMAQQTKAPTPARQRGPGLPGTQGATACPPSGSEAATAGADPPFLDQPKRPGV